AIIKKLQEKKTQVPLVIMTYINPVYQYGIEAFVKDLAETSVKGLIIPDLPDEHADFITPYLKDSDIALVPLVSLTTGIDRQKQLIDGAEGFIYAVAINGVTGKTGNYRDDLDKHLANLTAHADIPVLTGFGVSTEDDIKRFNAVSDGVIVGSKIVRDLHDGKEKEVAEFVTFGSHFEK
ncbi:MAG: tryptophan synthase subunit alpha, partial [Streptococcus salivarius]